MNFFFPPTFALTSLVCCCGGWGGDGRIAFPFFNVMILITELQYVTTLTTFRGIESESCKRKDLI